MFSARAVAGEVNTAANDQLEAWTEKGKNPFSLGKVRLICGPETVDSL